MWATGTKHGKEYLLLLCLPMYIVLHVSVVATPHQTPTRNFSWTNSQLIFESFQSLIVAFPPPFPRCQWYIYPQLTSRRCCWVFISPVDCCFEFILDVSHNFSWTVVLLNYISPDWLSNPSDLWLVHLIPTSLIPPRPMLYIAPIDRWCWMFVYPFDYCFVFIFVLYYIVWLPFPSH